MTRSELALRLALDRPRLSRAEIERAVKVIFSEMAAALARGDRVELRRFGTFSSRRLEAREFTNLRSGKAIDAPAKLRPRFRASKHLLRRMNDSRG